MGEEGKNRPGNLPLSLQNLVLQTPLSELGFSSLNPIKPLILLVGSSGDTVSQGSGVAAGSFRLGCGIKAFSLSVGNQNGHHSLLFTSRTEEAKAQLFYWTGFKKN